MTVYMRNPGWPGSAIKVETGPFVWHTSDGKYHFSGATLSDGKYWPNDFCFDRCFALECNRSLVLSGQTIAILRDGSVETLFPDTAARGKGAWSYFLEWPCLFLGEQSSDAWIGVKNYVEEWSIADSDARQMLRAMQEWERESVQTIRCAWDVIQRISATTDFRGETEIIAAGKQWLFYNNDISLLAMGYEKDLWGKTTWPKQPVVYAAAPVRDGWIVTLLDDSRYLLRQNDPHIEIHPLVYPSGPWERQGEWTYWYRRGFILTPKHQLFQITEGLTLCGGSERWAYLISKYWTKNVMVLVDPQGKQHKVPIPQGRTEIYTAKQQRTPEFLVGNKSLFAIVSDWKYQTILLYDANSDPPFRLLWEAACVPTKIVTTKIGLIRGDIDVLVIIFRLHKHKTVFACLCDSWRRAWVVPLPVTSVQSISVNGPETAQSGTKLLGDTRRRPLIPTRHLEAWVSNDTGYIRIDQEVVISGTMVPLSPKPNSLLDYMFSSVHGYLSQNREA